MAIASSVLQFMIDRIKCKTLFITHYPLIAESLEARYPQQVANKHMGFMEEGSGKKRTIHFLYTLSDGMAPSSYGIDCARLAGLSEIVLDKATLKAEAMKKSIEYKTTGAKYDRISYLLGASYLICYCRLRKIMLVAQRCMKGGLSEGRFRASGNEEGYRGIGLGRWKTGQP